MIENCGNVLESKLVDVKTEIKDLLKELRLN